MSTSYAVSKTATTFQVSYRSTGPDGSGNYTFNQRRGFLPFDLSIAGIDPATVESAILILRCTATVGGGATVDLHTAIDPNGFGATLDATYADWNSTATYLEDTVVVSSTGFHQWNVSPSHLNGSGITYFRLRNIDEDGGTSIPPYQTSVTFNASEAGTPSNRPVLRLTLFSGQIIFVQIGHK